MVNFRIKKIIESSGVKKKEVAKRLGISRQALNNWEKEDTDEHYKKVKAVLRVGDTQEQYGLKEQDNIAETLTFLVNKVKQLEEENNYLKEENRELRQLLSKGDTSYNKFEQKMK